MHTQEFHIRSSKQKDTQDGNLVLGGRMQAEDDGNRQQEDHKVWGGRQLSPFVASEESLTSDDIRDCHAVPDGQTVYTFIVVERLDERCHRDAL